MLGHDTLLSSSSYNHNLTIDFGRTIKLCKVVSPESKPGSFKG